MPLVEYLDSLHKELKTKSDGSMKPGTNSNPESRPTKKSKSPVVFSFSLLKSTGTTSEVIAARMERESKRKVSSGKFKRRWTSGQFTELNL